MSIDKNSAKPNTVAESQSATPENSRAVSGPMAAQLPVDPVIWAEARRLVGDKKVRVEDLAVCVSQDPIIVLELLKISNALYFSAGRPAISSTKTAIVRLGSDVVLETLEKLREREPVRDEDVRHWLEVHRNRCKRTAIVARIVSEAVAKQLSDDCQAAGVLMHVGEMVAAVHFAADYVRLAEEHAQAAINYRLAQDYKFDVEKFTVNYLRRNGVPEVLLFALEREGRPRTADRAVMKPICMAAGEMVEAFDANRWERLAPGKKIPPKSAIRLLQLDDTQYLRIYERVSEFLFSIRLLDERKKQEALRAASAAQVAPEPAEPSAPRDDQFESEIQRLISGAFEVPEDRGQGDSGAVVASEVSETTIAEVDEEIPTSEAFSLDAPKKREARAAGVPPPPVQPRVLRTSKGTKAVQSIASMFDEAHSSEELLAELLAMLVDNGPFKQSALIVVSRDRKQALVVAARGKGIGNGQLLTLDDPLSPLAQCFTKVQSWGNKKAACSPFGSKAFALAPIDADHDTPVALYADCGPEGSVSFEARRVFRTVVEILNEKLPHVPGGIPNELSK